MTIVRIIALCLVVIMAFSVVTFAEKMLLSKDETTEDYATDESFGVFRIDGSMTNYYGGSGAYYFKKGMTWEEFIESDLNSDNRFIITDGGYVAWAYTDSETTQDYERLCEYDDNANVYFRFYSDAKIYDTTYYIADSLPDQY